MMSPAANSPGYTAAEFAQDIATVLPFALPELQKLGLMTTCAHCGMPFDGAAFVLHTGSLHDDIVEVQILALCKAEATSPPQLSPNDWAYVSDSSGLFPAEHEWASLIQALRCYAIAVIHEYRGGLILATADTTSRCGAGANAHTMKSQGAPKLIRSGTRWRGKP